MAQQLVTSLRFKDALTWRAGRPIPVKNLLKSLQTLSEELREYDQEEVDRDSLPGVAHDLAGNQLLSHKEAGVKAFTACCLVDILRLTAPDAPFTAHQLKDIFNLLVTNIIPAIEDPSNAFHAQHLYVLESLSSVKSILLIVDVQGANSLIRTLFTKCFDILSRPKEELSKNVEYNMTGLLECLIDEAQTLPPEAVDIILAQFLRADPKTAGIFAGRKASAADGAPNNVPPSYTVAKNLCNTCAARMSRYVAQYFSAVIVDAAALDVALKPRANQSKKRKSTDEEEVEEQGPSEEDLKELEKAHRMLRELWKSAPAILQNVVPQIDSELTTENNHLRMLATEAIGDMVAGIGAAGMPQMPQMDPAAYPVTEIRFGEAISTTRLPEAFARTHAATYTRFLGRQKDKHAPIRAAWTTAVGRILLTRGGGIGLDPREELSLIDSLAEMLVDSDDRVRISAIQAIGLFDVGDIVTRLGASGDMNKEGSLLKNLADRVREKKHTVRVEAGRLLGRIWASAVSDIASGKSEVKGLLCQIPSKVFEAFYINDRDVHALIDEILFEYFLPLSYPQIKKSDKVPANGSTTESPRRTKTTRNNAHGEDLDWLRVERILVLVANLDQRAKPVLFKLFARPVQLTDYIGVFLKKSEEYNGGVVDKQRNAVDIKAHLARLIDFFSKQTAEPQKTAEDLWKFVKLHDRRSYALIRFCIAPESDYRKVSNSLKELRKRLSTANHAQNTTLPETIFSFTQRTANLFYNKSHIQPIIKISQNNEKGLGSAAHELMLELSSKNPSVFKSHAEEMCRTLQNQAPSSSQANDATAIDGLRACATFAKKYPEGIPKDRKFQHAMTQYALRGSPPAASKYAVSILMASSEKKESVSRDLMKQCTDAYEYGSAHFLSKLACLSQLMLTSGQDLEDHLDSVIDIAIHQTLLQVRSGEENTEANDSKAWPEQIDEECEAKIWAMKILVNRIRSYQDAAQAKEVAKPVYQLLTTLVSKRGELSKRTKTPEAHKLRLCLEGALLLLKLSKNRSFDQFIGPSQFQHLALLAQDPLFELRSAFVRKTMKYLGQDLLPSRFYTIPFLLAFEPSGTLKKETETWLASRSNTLQKTTRMTLEGCFARFLSVLAHHPDFSTSLKELEDFVSYIIFYLRPVATEENLGIIYHVAQRVKSVQDGMDESKSDNLYLLSDLAQAVIKAYEESQNWSMQAFAGKMQMPVGIFAALPDHVTAQEIATKQYVPDELVDAVDDLVKGLLKPRSKKRKPTESSNAARPAKSRRVTHLDGPSSKPPRKTMTAKPKRSRKRSGDDDDGGPQSESNVPSSASRRRSGRSTANKSYIEKADSEDDAEMNEWDQQTVSKPRAAADEDDGDEEEEKEEEDEEDEEEAEEEEDEQEETADEHDAKADEDVHMDSDPPEIREPEEEEQEAPAPEEGSEKENSTGKTRGKKAAAPAKSAKSVQPVKAAANNTVSTAAAGRPRRHR